MQYGGPKFKIVVVSYQTIQYKYILYGEDVQDPTRQITVLRFLFIHN